MLGILSFAHVRFAVLRRRRHGRLRLLRRGRILQQVLHHVEAQFFGLAGEHFGELEEVQEEHQLQVFAGELFAFLRGRLGARGGLAGLIDGDPVVLQGRGLREGGGG